MGDLTGGVPDPKSRLRCGAAGKAVSWDWNLDEIRRGRAQKLLQAASVTVRRGTGGDRASSPQGSREQRGWPAKRLSQG
jgi:hypothetical protein